MQVPSVLPGGKFWRLTVVSREDVAWAICECECGTKGFRTRAHGLKVGSTRSCGCLKRESDRAKIIARNKAGATHGMGHGKDITYNCWNGMVHRCRNPENGTYERYGGRGIKVCDCLAADPRNLVAVIGKRQSAEYSIDRFPSNAGHYSCGQCEDCKANGWPLNIRWATKVEQMRNMGSNASLTAFGKTLLRCEWAEISGINMETVRKRMIRGWTIEEALTTPDDEGNCYKPEGELILARKKRG